MAVVLQHAVCCDTGLTRGVHLQQLVGCDGHITLPGALQSVVSGDTGVLHPLRPASPPGGRLAGRKPPSMTNSVP